MGVNIDISSFKCFNQLRNGEDFDQNPNEFTPNLVGNVGEKVKIEFSADFSYNSSAEGSEIWNVQGGRIERSTGNFKDDGIVVGNRLTFYKSWSNRFDVNNIEFFADVDSISSDGTVLTFTLFAGAQSTVGEVTNVGFTIDTALFTENLYTASLLRYGLINNDEPFNFISKTTKGQQVFYAIELALFSEVDYISLGKLKDWVSGKSTIELVPSPEDTFVARYNITHEFVLNPWYILEFKTNLLNDTVPELLTGDNSLKYAFDLEFRQTLTDIASKKNRFTEDIGGVVGWFGENFNGFNNNYQINSISYEDNDTTDPLDGIGINNNTKVTVIIARKTGSITTDFSASAHISLLPVSESEYQETETDMVQNFLFDSLTLAHPDTSNTGTGIIKSLDSVLNAGILTLTYVITYDTLDKLRLTEDSEYITWIQIEDDTLATGNSDRVAILADLRNYTDANFVADFLNFTEYDFFTHELERGVDDPKAAITDGINEDGIALSTRFSSDASKNVVINTIRHALIARNLTTGIFFELDNYDVDIGATITDGDGVQQFTIQVGRGYDLLADDQFNLVELLTKNKVVDDQFYEGYFGQKIKWQDWISNGDVDTVFFDSAFPNDNLNFRTSNYSEKNDYEIFLATIVNVSGNDDLGRSVTGDFIQLGNKIIVDDYDDNPDITGVIETFDPDTGQSLGGAVLYNGKDTVVKTTYTRVASEAVDYAIHRIEPSLSLGTGIQELSSKFPFPANNIMIPIIGQTQLNITDNGLTVITESLISGAKVQEGIDYKLSSRIGAGLVAPVSFIYSVTVSASETISLPMFNGDDSLYSFMVSFGDGSGIKSVNAYADVDRQHTYTGAGTFDITVTGTFDRILFADSPTSIVELKAFGTAKIGPQSFIDTTNFITLSATDKPGLFSTSLLECFRNADLTTVDAAIDTWDVSTVTNFGSMFRLNNSFNADIGSWDMGAALATDSMFHSNSLFNQDIGSWNVANITNMSTMFFSCSVFNQDIGSWNVGSVANFLQMFRSASVFNQDIGSWNMTSATDLSFMFFSASAFNQDISGWNTANVINLNSMFVAAVAFNQDISGWNTGSVTNMNNAFQTANSFDQDLGAWDITAMTQASNMFQGITLSTVNYDGILTGWEAQVENTNVTFHGGNSLFTKAPSAAATARGVLVATSTWTITEGGPTPYIHGSEDNINSDF